MTPLKAVLNEVRQVCADVRQRLSATSSAGVTLAHIEKMIDEPLRVAVVGRPTCGRSTLVNAILGRRTTDGWWSDRQSPVTWFRFDDHERVELIFDDGRKRPLPEMPPPGGPVEWPRDVNGLRRLEVRLPAPVLREMTLVYAPEPRALAGYHLWGDEPVGAMVLLYDGSPDPGETEQLSRFHDLAHSLDTTALVRRVASDATPGAIRRTA